MHGVDLSLTAQLLGDGLQGVDHEVQGFAAGQAFDTSAAEVLLRIAALRRDKRLRQDVGVFHQIGYVEHQATPPRLAVQNGQTMREAQHPGGSGAQAVSQVVAMVKELIGRITTAASLGAREVAILRSTGGKHVQVFGQACLFREQRRIVWSSSHVACRGIEGLLQCGCIHSKTRRA